MVYILYLTVRRPIVYWSERRLRKHTIALLLILMSPLPAFAQPVVIAALGDSLTQGFGLQNGDGFVPKLEHWLRTQGEDVTILNAGVSGDTTAGGLSRIAWTLTPDVDALIITLGGNDLLRGIDPSASRANLMGILDIASERNLPVLLVGIAAPGNYGPEYKAEFDSIYPDLSDEYGVLLYENFFTALLPEPKQKTPSLKFMQNDNIHPNAEGVARIVAAIGPKVRKLVNQIGK
jgi:acyl-CoA thioesterase I